MSFHQLHALLFHFITYWKNSTFSVHIYFCSDKFDFCCLSIYQLTYHYYLFIYLFILKIYCLILKTCNCTYKPICSVTYHSLNARQGCNMLGLRYDGDRADFKVTHSSQLKITIDGKKWEILIYSTAFNDIVHLYLFSFGVWTERLINIMWTTHIRHQMYMYIRHQMCMCIRNQMYMYIRHQMYMYIRI